MALTKCIKCGKEFYGVVCPSCDGNSQPAPKSSQSAKLGCLGFAVLMLVVIGACHNFFGGGSASTTSAPDSPPYFVVEQWSIPNGGYGRAIVIDPQYRNEQDMGRLAARLDYDTRQDRNAFIFIYDDRRAAFMRKAALEERLDKPDLQHYAAHRIGSYTKNANTGYHALTLTLDSTAR